MTIETRKNDDMRDLRARIVVLETIQNQLLFAAARLSGSPEPFLQGLMQSAANTLQAASKLAGNEAEAETAADALSSFGDRSMRLIAALMPKGAKN